MRIVWSERARQELADAYGFVKMMFGVAVATKMKKEIRESTLLLIEHPNLGLVERLLDNRVIIYRSLITGYYKIIYSVNNKTIYISALWHCSQDPEKLEKENV